VEPATASVDVVDGAVATQVYRAYLVDADGNRTDVTDRAAFSIADERFGHATGSSVVATGAGAGVTHVIARLPGRTRLVASSELAVHVKVTDTSDVDASMVHAFDSASNVVGCATRIAYPADGTVVPANLGRMDVQFTDADHDIYRIRLSNAYVDYTLYTHDARPQAIDGARWQWFATSRHHMQLDVAAMDSSAPAAMCATRPRTVDITDTDVNGAVYYIATDDGTPNASRVVRHDMVTGRSETMQTADAQCVGCHAVSRDGRRMAVSVDAAGGRGAVYDLATGDTMPMGTDAHWTSATFTPDGKQLLTVESGTMNLFDVATGRKLATYETGTVTGNPEISPDGQHVVSVEVAGGSDWDFAGAQVVVRELSQDTLRLGEPKTLVSFDDASGMQSYYPSWSPDGKYVAITRSASGDSYSSTDASVWVVAANGGLPPVQITAPGETGSWARWMPFGSTVHGEPVYFLSFSSARDFGISYPRDRQQIWIAPFFPYRAYEKPFASAPAYHAPFQSTLTENHNAQWATTAVGM
jgi:Tol biopolymer transport system component